MREDSAWFFTAGKAWMEGMTPYIDFADSKGPLLWLIYGIGYLLSPTSYIGVFWISILAYTLTFAVLWRTARLFFGKRESLIVLVLMPVLMFYRVLHDEVRAEDFCMLGICIGIYCTCRALMSPESASVRKYAFGLGASMAWCLLIKWNLFVLMGGMALVVLGVSFSRRRVDALFFGLFGIAVVTLPFVVYFLWKGNFMAMVQEYFVNTFQISGRGKNLELTVFYTLLTKRMSVYYTVMLLGVVVGICFFCRRFRVSYWLLVAYIPFVVFLELQLSRHYYFAIVMPFYVFFLIFLVGCCSWLICRLPKSLFVAIAIVVCLVGTAYNTRWWNFIFFPSADQERWDEIQSVMQRKQRPRMLVLSGDYGFGLLMRALPACKYWAFQYGSSENMKEQRYNAIRAKKPDFVIAVNRYLDEKNAKYAKFFTVLHESGYRQCCVMVKKNGKTIKKAVPVYAKE